MESGNNIERFEINFGYSDSSHNLNNKLHELGFFSNGFHETPNGKTWVEIIDHSLLLLNQSFTYASHLRTLAQKWEREFRDMTPWISLLYSIKFKERLRDGATISNGHVDHWIDDIPIEDKLLRESTHSNIDDVIEELIENHLNQALREAISSGFGVLCVVDIRTEIKNNTLPASPSHKCFRIIHENDCWIFLIIFQAFTETPSRL